MTTFNKFLHQPWTGSLLHTDVAETCRLEHARLLKEARRLKRHEAKLAKLAKLNANVVQLNFRKAKP